MSLILRNVLQVTFAETRPAGPTSPDSRPLRSAIECWGDRFAFNHLAVVHRRLNDPQI